MSQNVAFGILAESLAPVESKTPIRQHWLQLTTSDDEDVSDDNFILIMWGVGRVLTSHGRMVDDSGTHKNGVHTSLIVYDFIQKQVIIYIISFRLSDFVARAVALHHKVLLSC